MTEYVYCPGCGQVVEASEPCPCVFEARGDVDERGVLHTAQRLPLIVDDELDEVVHIQHVVQVGPESYWCCWHDCDAHRCFPKPAGLCDACGELRLIRPDGPCCPQCGAR